MNVNQEISAIKRQITSHMEESTMLYDRLLELEKEKGITKGNKKAIGLLRVFKDSLYGNLNLLKDWLSDLETVDKTRKINGQYHVPDKPTNWTPHPEDFPDGYYSAGGTWIENIPDDERHPSDFGR